MLYGVSFEIGFGLFGNTTIPAVLMGCGPLVTALLHTSAAS